jgi:hypothetical protein
MNFINNRPLLGGCFVLQYFEELQYFYATFKINLFLRPADNAPAQKTTL